MPVALPRRTVRLLAVRSGQRGHSGWSGLRGRQADTGILLREVEAVRGGPTRSWKSTRSTHSASSSSTFAKRSRPVSNFGDVRKGRSLGRSLQESCAEESHRFDVRDPLLRPFYKADFISMSNDDFKMTKTGGDPVGTDTDGEPEGHTPGSASSGSGPVLKDAAEGPVRAPSSGFR
jgi:hypothetical protein